MTTRRASRHREWASRSSDWRLKAKLDFITAQSNLSSYFPSGVVGVHHRGPVFQKSGKHRIYKHGFNLKKQSQTLI